MSTKKNGAANQGTTPTSKVSVCKGTTFPPHLQQVFDILSDGNKYTAKEINQRSGRNDARKAISELRNCPYKLNIQDIVTPKRYKLYWLQSKNPLYKQTELFPAGDD